jgi:triacylglycerol lipase
MSILTELPEDQYEPAAFDAPLVAPGYDRNTALALMWLCQLSYEHPQSSTVAAVRQRWGLQLLGAVSGTILLAGQTADTMAYVVAKGDDVFIAVRGTDPIVLSAWITNFDIIPLPNGRHTGFDNAAEVLWAGIRPIVTAATAGKPRARLFLTGHSLGGAVAILTALRASEQALPLVAIYSFAMPRAGTVPFSDAYNSALGERTFRFAYGDDIVPMVPPEPIFAHVGRYFYSRSGQFPDQPTVGWPNDPRLDASLLQSIRGFVAQGPGRWSLVKNSLFGSDHGVAGKPLPRRPPAVAFLFAHLPSPIRDHIQDRYWQAL